MGNRMLNGKCSTEMGNTIFISMNIPKRDVPPLPYSSQWLLHLEVAILLSHLPTFYISFQHCNQSILAATGIVTVLSMCKFHNR